MRHLAILTAEREQHRLQAEEWQRRIADWYLQADRPLASKAAFFEAHLERYALALRDADPDRKTVGLPSGKVSTRAHQAKAVVVDEDTVVEWATQTLPREAWNEVVRLKVQVSGLRQHVILVEVPEQVVLSCGCVGKPHVPFDTPEQVAAWTVGSAVACPACGEVALVGRWVDTRLVVRGPDGLPVPGVDVAPADVTVSVHPDVP